MQPFLLLSLPPHPPDLLPPSKDLSRQEKRKRRCTRNRGQRDKQQEDRIYRLTYKAQIPTLQTLQTQERGSHQGPHSKNGCSAPRGSWGSGKGTGATKHRFIPPFLSNNSVHFFLSRQSVLLASVIPGLDLWWTIGTLSAISPPTPCAPTTPIIPCTHVPPVTLAAFVPTVPSPAPSSTANGGVVLHGFLQRGG